MNPTGSVVTVVCAASDAAQRQAGARSERENFIVVSAKATSARVRDSPSYFKTNRERSEKDRCRVQAVVIPESASSVYGRAMPELFRTMIASPLSIRPLQFTSARKVNFSRLIPNHNRVTIICPTQGCNVTEQHAHRDCHVTGPGAITYSKEINRQCLRARHSRQVSSPV